MTTPMTDAEWLASEHDRLDRVVRRMRERQLSLRRQIDKINLAKRPVYPTEEQALGLVEAARQIHGDITAASHHGDPTPTYAVVVDGCRSWLNVRHGAPCSRVSPGGSLWTFTDDEVWAFAEILAEQGLRVTDHWLCDGGVSFYTEEA